MTHMNVGASRGDVFSCMPADMCIRAPQVARTSTGVYVSSRLSGRDSEADEEDTDPCLEVENLMCVTVDACGRSTSGFMNAHFRYSRAALRSDDDEGDDLDEDLEGGSDGDVETYSLEVGSPIETYCSAAAVSVLLQSSTPPARGKFVQVCCKLDRYLNNAP